MQKVSEPLAGESMPLEGPEGPYEAEEDKGRVPMIDIGESGVLPPGYLVDQLIQGEAPGREEGPGAREGCQSGLEIQGRALPRKDDDRLFAR